MKLKDFPWLSLLLAGLCLWFGHRVGFDVGRRTERARLVIERSLIDTTTSRSTMASRNLVWQTMNGDSTPDVPERKIAFALMRVLDGRASYDDRYNGLTAFRHKGNAYLTDQEQENLKKVFETDDSPELVEEFARIVAYDAQASELISAILDDRVRLYAYREKRRIDLETSSDGSVP